MARTRPMENNLPQPEIDEEPELNAVDTVNVIVEKTDQLKVTPFHKLYNSDFENCHAPIREYRERLVRCRLQRRLFNRDLYKLGRDISASTHRYQGELRVTIKPYNSHKEPVGAGISLSPSNYTELHREKDTILQKAIEVKNSRVEQAKVYLGNKKAVIIRKMNATEGQKLRTEEKELMIGLFVTYKTENGFVESDRFGLWLLETEFYKFIHLDSELKESEEELENVRMCYDSPDHSGEELIACKFCNAYGDLKNTAWEINQ